MSNAADAVTGPLRTLTTWLAKRAPSLANSLATPASPEAIAEIEAILGCPIPADYRAFLELHDGQRFVPVDEAHGTLAPLFSGFDLLPAAFAAGEYETIQNDWDEEGPGDIEAHGPVRAMYKNPRWWPITCVFGASQYHCLDFDPAPGGTVGQVIFIADDDENRRVVAPSFTAFLTKIAATLTAPDVKASDDGIDLPDEVFDSLLE